MNLTAKEVSKIAFENENNGEILRVQGEILKAAHEGKESIHCTILKTSTSSHLVRSGFQVRVIRLHQTYEVSWPKWSTYL